jgi:hypothetical protein
MWLASDPSIKPRREAAMPSEEDFFDRTIDLMLLTAALIAIGYLGFSLYHVIWPDLPQQAQLLGHGLLNIVAGRYLNHD